MAKVMRKIIRIDEEKCDGCGLCATACHEGAIAIIDGKAKLMRDDFCDGFGDCLPACHTGAISFEVRVADEYDEAAVQEALRAKAQADTQAPATFAKPISQLRQWPIQIKLAPVHAPFFDGAKLLVAADCCAYAYANMHEEFMRGKVTIIGCPKLDGVDYTDKLTQIIQNNDIRSVSIVRMEVPCCGGIQYATQNALQASGKFIPWQVATISTDGRLLD